jgi:hypothetical protein
LLLHVFVKTKSIFHASLKLVPAATCEAKAALDWFGRYDAIAIDAPAVLSFTNAHARLCRIIMAHIATTRATRLSARKIIRASNNQSGETPMIIAYSFW